ncbi:restriction endonuclease, SacI family [uncultured Desulfovibrio sp.]|uniref:restriction endonuclease, SacI family n=1 Tax=uncultured Desulfovibrio sp. TaxID=167968 RepID=UPI0026306199|nr:restriction endonuclease, SacI family [uncultured Desulfovibrio sp.]
MQPEIILEDIYNIAQILIQSNQFRQFDKTTQEKVKKICNDLRNRACARFLMACMLGKICIPTADPRKPYTEIGGNDCFSGRKYDESYLTAFITKHKLPLNQTTAFLTPTFRNINHELNNNTTLVGRPKELYKDTISLLNDVAENRITAKDLLTEILVNLILLRNEKQRRIDSLLRSLQSQDNTPTDISSEAIITLLQQHLACKNSSRLPVLIVAAAYAVAKNFLFEQVRPLQAHNAADAQTGSLGDLEICLINEEKVLTVYEMKTRQVTQDDIDAAIHKISTSGTKINNYIFITTEHIKQDVFDYAASCYEKTCGIEIVILDCISFIRYFLHLFHRLRTEYLNAYQEILLKEPDSAVNQPLKEAFLALRQAAESGE